MSLKHKNTSKWAKAQNKYAKYSERARDQVQEQLELSKQLTKKVKKVELDDDDDIKEEENEQIKKETLLLSQNGLLVNNPWMKMMRGVTGQSSENNDAPIEESVSEFSKPKAFTNQSEIEQAQQRAEMEEQDEQESDDDLNDDVEIVKEKESNKRVTSIFSPKEKTKNSKKVKLGKEAKEEKDAVESSLTISEKPNASVPEKNIEPLFVQPKRVKSLKQVEDIEDEETNNKSEHQITLSEAFADDDVIEEFKMEKVTKRS